VRVKCALGVVELAAPAAALRAAFVERGLWLRPFGNTVYVMPPFVIDAGDLSRLTAGVCEVVGEWSRTRPAGSARDVA
jgi:adenosylmethionine-8-amino-7-oxononanoate aminotransferase